MQNTYLAYGECHQVMPREQVPGATLGRPVWFGMDMGSTEGDKTAMLDVSNWKDGEQTTC